MKWASLAIQSPTHPSRWPSSPSKLVPPLYSQDTLSVGDMIINASQQHYQGDQGLNVCKSLNESLFLQGELLSQCPCHRKTLTSKYFIAAITSDVDMKLTPALYPFAAAEWHFRRSTQPFAGQALDPPGLQDTRIPAQKNPAPGFDFGSCSSALEPAHRLTPLLAFTQGLSVGALLDWAGGQCGMSLHFLPNLVPKLQKY